MYIKNAIYLSPYIYLFACIIIYINLGVLEEKVFEADPNIQFTYAWDRLNIYRQRVYGVTTANVKVYIYRVYGVTTANVKVYI